MISVARVTHIPVMVAETVAALQVSAGKTYIDCTLGSGGHAAAILTRSVPGGRLLGLDSDAQAVEAARERLSPFGGAALAVRMNFSQLLIAASLHGFLRVDGILFDLGLASPQLDSSGRGFSFQRDEPLDMRFDDSQELTADYIVNSYSEAELAQLLKKYGEERQSRFIARHIVNSRPIHSSRELALVIERAVGTRERIHPATRSFQALRITVNDELENLSRALPQTLDLLAPGGRLAVISYHSLEDRLVKQFIRRESRDCLCPPEIPVCVCGHIARLRLITPKPLVPTTDEVKDNPRSRSAKLRVAERL
ncbi:MAG: 16S rRNA (cytosine(1402)-N(4))-methyltransferase RsmH [Chloroflexota bacterium]